MNDLTIQLVPNSRTPLYEQIYSFIKGEIRSGRIVCGEKLPSTRAIAGRLEISRSTVELAYEQLVAEGYIEAIPCRGFFVSKLDDLYLPENRTEIPVRGEGKEKAGDESYEYDFSPFGIDFDSFPYATWMKLTRETLAGEGKELFSMGEPQGEYDFRESICNYLYASRGMNVRPENLVIGAGSDYLNMQLVSILNENGDLKVAMETPTYVREYELLENLGVEVCTVGMDDSGIRVDELESSGANVAFIMPSHHFPMGTVTSIGRRMECIRWAMRAENRYLIEDDYDSEFRYRGKPIPALQGIDNGGKVIYMGTFSKAIAPSIRISYMVLPDKLMERYREGIGRAGSTVSRIDQKIVKEFLDRGSFERHLNKMRGVYKTKRDVIIEELKDSFSFAKVFGDAAGVHVLVNMGNHMTEEEAVGLAGKQKVKVYGLSEFFVNGDKPIEDTIIILGFASMTVSEIREAMARLKIAWS